MAILIRAVIAAATLAIAGPAIGQASLEYAVKANFLYKFAPFVVWPSQALAGSPALRICIAGADPFGRLLDDAVRGQRVGGRPITVRRMQRVAGPEGCHILFAGQSRAQSAADMLRAVAGKPVLTITDEQQGVSGGMIHFVLRGGRVRFTIDRAAAGSSGLDINSKLLDLAVAGEG